MGRGGWGRDESDGILAPKTAPEVYDCMRLYDAFALGEVFGIGFLPRKSLDIPTCSWDLGLGLVIVSFFPGILLPRSNKPLHEGLKERKTVATGCSHEFQ